MNFFSYEQVKGWCVGDGDSLENIAVITELCSPVDTVSLLQMTFRQRLEVRNFLLKYFACAIFINFSFSR